jgi:hypothetical protein
VCGLNNTEGFIDAHLGLDEARTLLIRAGIS